MPIQRELILLIIIVTYAGVAVGAFPYLRMNRATIALVGAVALMIAGAVSFMRRSTPGSWRTVTKPWLAMMSGVSAEGWFAVCRSRICRTSSAFDTVVKWMSLVTAWEYGFC